MAMTGGTAVLVYTGYGNGNSSNPIKVYVYYKISQSTANNQSTITCGMYVTTPSTAYEIGPWDDWNGSYIGTTALTFNGYIPLFAGTRWIVENKSFTVNHNADGTGSATIYWHWGVNSPWGRIQNPSGSFKINLPTIPRQSSLSLSKTNLNVGDKITATITRASTSYTHTVKFYINKNYTNTYTNVATSQEFTIPESWYNAMPSSTSCTAYCKVITYSGSTQIGSEVTKSFTVNVPSNIVPSIGSFTATPVDGVNQCYVQGMSKCQLVMTNIKAGAGSVIKNYSITGASISTGSASIGQSSLTQISIKTDIIMSSGTIVYTATVVDNRGRSAKKTCSIDVCSYGKPTISVSAQRSATESGTVIIKYNASCSSVNGANVLNNIYISYKLKTNSTWISWKNISISDQNTSSYQGEDITSSWDFDKEYEVRMYASDTLGGESDWSNVALVTTVTRPININKNKNGVAIGKLSTKNAFECAMNAEFTNNLSVANDLSVAKITKLYGGRYVHSAVGTSGSNGYIKIASISVTGSYANQIISFKFVRRKDTEVTECCISFVSASGTDPDLQFWVFGGCVDVFANKSETSKWDIYIQKTEAYDRIDVFDYNIGIYMQQRITLSWSDEFASALPSSHITAIKRQVALSDHNHNSVYSLIGHNHDSSYSKLNHNHDSLYAPINHFTKYTLLLGSTVLSNNRTVNFTIPNGYNIFIVCSFIESQWYTTVVNLPAFSSTDVQVATPSDVYPFRISTSGTTGTLKRVGSASVTYYVYGVN